ncbi:MAG: glycosyltransferase [Lachnospiraceae bacterium]|jgi:glycosyltransferase involved in cell wall biosynthesis|nr:glycosyltransferase [Lachnospiraceae bacterium]
MAKILNLLYAGEIGGIEVLCENIGLRAEYPNTFCFIFGEGKIYDEMIAKHLNVISLAEQGKKKLTLRKIRELAEEAEKNDIIVTHHANISLQLVYFLLRHIARNRYFVMVAHSCFDKGVYFTYSDRWKNRLFEWLLKSNLKNSDGILFVSEAGRQSYTQYFNFDMRKTRVIYNGVPIRNRPLEPPIVSKNTVFHLLYIGRLVEGKGVQVLIDAIRQMVDQGEDIMLTIVGEGGYRNNLEKQVKEDGLSKRILFEGPQRNIRKYFEQADGFVYPSILQEVFGISIVEAMEAGVPCIGFRVGGIPEIIKDGVNGFIAEDISVQGLIYAISKLQKAYRCGEIIQIREACVKTANKFSINNTIIELTQFYDELIKGINNDTNKKFN